MEGCGGCLGRMIGSGSIDALVLAGHPTKNQTEIVLWCRQNGIPTLSFAMELQYENGEEAEAVEDQTVGPASYPYLRPAQHPRTSALGSLSASCNRRSISGYYLS